jgi:hypothetical protein
VGGELAIRPICAVHNESQDHFIALQHFFVAKGFAPGSGPDQSDKISLIIINYTAKLN